MWIRSGLWGRSLRSGGGIGDVLEAVAMHEPGHLARFLYDTAFYYLMIVLLMNLLFGIIIDTFADLREEKSSTCSWPYFQWSLALRFLRRTWARHGALVVPELPEKDDLMFNTCVLCGLERDRFERQRPGMSHQHKITSAKRESSHAGLPLTTWPGRSEARVIRGSHFPHQR